MKRIALLTLLSLITIPFVSFAQPGRGPGGGGSVPMQMMHMGRFNGGNQSRGYLAGTVNLTPENADEEEAPGYGAVVLVVTSKKDTLYTTAGENGSFRLFNVPTGNAYVSFSLMGYKEEAKTINVTPGENKIVVYLKPESFQIKEAVLKADVPPVSVDKDTIIFRASAVKVNKGEMAVDILSQMPGVEVGDSGVTVLNEAVTNVYIDGSLLFGEAPMKALNNLPAEEVIDIKSYQEYANKDPYHKISKNESKERVLDVRTKSKPKFVANGDFIGGAGYDTDTTYHKFRYTLGTTVNATSEKLQAYVSYNMNNINDSSNRRRGNSFRNAGGGGGSPDLRNITFSTGINKKWMSPTTRNFVLGSIGGDYSYSNNYNVNESITQLVYFANDQYDSRVEDRTSYSDATSKSHNVSVNGLKALRDGAINARASVRLTENENFSLSSNYNTQDDLPRQGTSSSNRSNSDGQSYNGNINFSKRFFDKLGVNMTIDGTISDDDNTSVKVDTTTSTITYKTLDISNIGNSHNWGLNPSVSWEIDDSRTISLGYGYSNNYSMTERWAYDVTAEREVDRVNSYTHTTDNNTHQGNLSYRSHWDKWNANLWLMMSYASTGLNKHETFPEEDIYDHRFNSFNPSINIGNESMINHWSLRIRSGNNTPSLEQIRPKINNSNLYNVSAGNPDLKQSRNYNAGFSYGTVLGAQVRATVREMEETGTVSDPRSMQSISTFSMDGSFGTNLSPIVNRRIYYAEETFLPTYNYTMPAQSNFSTYENAPASYNANFNLRFGIHLQKILCMLNISTSMNWDSSPSYINYDLTRTQNLRPSLNVGLRSNFSRNFRFNISCNGAYIYSYNDLQNVTSYFTERINAGWEVNNILKHGYLGGNYNKGFTQGLAYTKIDDNIFNMRGGLRFGPRDNCDFSVSVHDLFNKTKGFSTSMNSNYVTNSWAHNFGRYVMFTFTYRFTSMKGGNTGGGGGRGGFGGGGFGGFGGGRGGWGGGGWGGGWGGF